jgi:hypothetical protein
VRAARAVPVGLIPAFVLAACAAFALAGCGGGVRAQAADSCPTCAAEVSQARADAFATVGRRVYAQEVSGPANGGAYHVISRIPGLLDGLTTRNYALARSAMHHQPIRHAVGVRVTRGGRTLIDVSLRFVVAGRVRALRDRSGRYLGRIEISIQDVIGFVRLIHRLTGAQAVVEGSTGETMTTFTAAADLPLPARGPAIVAGRQYTVSSFTERGFAGEPLHVFVLAPS